MSPLPSKIRSNYDSTKRKDEKAVWVELKQDNHQGITIDKPSDFAFLVEPTGALKKQLGELSECYPSRRNSLAGNGIFHRSLVSSQGFKDAYANDLYNGGVNPAKAVKRESQSQYCTMSERSNKKITNKTFDHRRSRANRSQNSVDNLEDKDNTMLNLV